ncbi:hypothetical protein Agabi119p4_5602 [Agaricus bisporus var. burnettii]|uniref:Ribonuclease P protein subunit n=1 Tax=Agaricus bisporus var. burnettii TaxID=192524 RepID=A0A8H7F275_AGABI|nr:hypothetical protein Agabi119p4_5602 [Agaricus bisporus var. burnettii]
MADKSNVKSIDLYKEFSAVTGKRVVFKSSTPYIPQYVTSNLSATSDPDALYANRVKGRQLLLENPVRKSEKRKAEEEKHRRAQESKKRKKLRVIGKREAKEKGVWKLDKSQAEYRLFVPLHHLWMSYMSELLTLALPPKDGCSPTTKSIPSSQTMFPKLVKADFHGAVISVRQSKNPCLVGITGIIIHETENAFKIITKTNAVKLIPKANSIFALSIPLYSTLPPSRNADTPFPILSPEETPETTVLDKPHFEFDLYGNQFRFRSADRAGRKFKHKETIEL